MEEESTRSEPALKSKISFSVESLLSSREVSASPKVEEPTQAECSRLGDDEEDEDITVDEDDDYAEAEGRESSSPNSGHTVLIPQPVHPSIPRLVATGQPHWPFTWPGHHPGLMRSSSPQSEFLIFGYVMNFLRSGIESLNITQQKLERRL